MEGLISKALIFCTMSLLSWKTSQVMLPPSSCDVLQSLSGKNKLSIPESNYTASSFVNNRYPPFKAKLNGSYGWAAKNNSNPHDYLQIDLGTPRVIVAVATQGNGGSLTNPNDRPQEWVTKYVISYRNSGKWIKYKEKRKMKVFKGNTDTKSVVRHFLKNPAKARYIRFVPVEYQTYKTMRVDVYFNNQEPPRIMSVVPRKRSIELSWTYKPCGPTRHIARYVVRLENKTGTYEVTSNGTVCNVTNLKPYTEYNVSIRAIQQVGYGVWANTTPTTTAIAEPESIPVNTSITSGSSQSILIEWKIPDRDKINGPLKGYRITYTPQGGNTKTLDVTGDVTAYNLTSLLKYTTYSISVAVMNTKYIGPASTRRSVRTMEDAPSAPVSVNGKLLPAQGSVGTRVVITWYRPCDLNGIIRKYTIVYYYNKDTSNKKIVTINGTGDLSYTINVNATENRTLSYKISATTLKEGPYADGKALIIPEYHINSQQTDDDAAAKESSVLFSHWMIAGLVGGFIVILLGLVIALYKRRHQDHRRKGEAMDPVPRFNSTPLAIIDDIPCDEYTCRVPWHSVGDAIANQNDNDYCEDFL